VEQNPTYTSRVDVVFDAIDAGSLTAVTSPITMAECLVMPLRLASPRAAQDFIDLIVHGGNTTFVPIDEGSARQAADLRARYNLGLSDAFQVATALEAGCNGFLTNDAALKRVQEIPILVLDDLEP